jgi:hypothetical protein
MCCPGEECVCHVEDTDICEERVCQKSRNKRAGIGDLAAVHNAVEHVVLEYSSEKTGVLCEASQGRIIDFSKCRIRRC